MLYANPDHSSSVSFEQLLCLEAARVIDVKSISLVRVEDIG